MIVLSVLLGGCSDDDRPGDRPESPLAITGDTVLLVVNRSYYLATVYFGKVVSSYAGPDARQRLTRSIA